MRTRRIVLFMIIVVAIGSLAAMAAIGTGGPDTLPVTPEVHRAGTDGYFRIRVPLPEAASKGVPALSAQVTEGDLFLVNAFAASREDADEGEIITTDTGTITVTGRFGRPGPARLTILARQEGGEAKPLLKLAFSLPATESSAPDVRAAWARQQQIAFFMADPDAEDSFSHYWNLAVAPHYGLSQGLNDGGARFRREPADLYSVFTGAAAIQESLQLELLGTGPQNAAQRDAIKKAGAVPDTVPLAGLAGPAVKSHPFREMLKGRSPQLPPLASFIPQDQYAVFFTDINKEIELADLMDEWGGNLLHQMETSARDFRVREKVSGQLCLENSWLTRMFGDRVVADMAFSGSDPFLKEGTGFAVLFSLKDRDRFRKQLVKRYDEAVAARGAARSEFTVAGKRGMAAVSPDRRVSSYTLILGNVAVVSTSKGALERVVAAGEKRLPSLAEADDFRYMRTIFPQNAQEEDIFIYLSDPHIRALVGPRAKIGEARRMRCAGNMALIANARLWFRAEKRREPTYADLAEGGYLGAKPPECPDHGRYAIDGNGEPSCSIHNRPGLLTPVEEVPPESVTREEAARYKAFVENYNHYWTRFFDPIGVRIKMGKDIRIQTCILPLIENSWYDGLAAFSGRTPGELTESAVLPRTIMSLRGHMATGWMKETAKKQKFGRDLKLDWLGDELALNLCDGQVLFSAGGRVMGLMGREMGRSSLEPLVIGYLGSALNLPTYLTVKVTDAGKAERAIPYLFGALGPEHGRDGGFSVETYTIEDHGGKPLYVANFNVWVLRLRLYAAVVDDQLVIASRRDIVTDLIDASARTGGAKVEKHEGNMELSIYRTGFKQLEETVNLGWQEDLRHACHKNLPLAEILLTTLGLPPDRLDSTALGLRGYQPYCPSGGRYVIDEKTGAVTCTVHGNRSRPRQPAAGDESSQTLKLVNSLEKVNARLAFTPEGLMTTLEIRRKSGR